MVTIERQQTHETLALSKRAQEARSGYNRILERASRQKDWQMIGYLRYDFEEYSSPNSLGIMTSDKITTNEHHQALFGAMDAHGRMESVFQKGEGGYIGEIYVITARHPGDIALSDFKSNRLRNMEFLALHLYPDEESARYSQSAPVEIWYARKKGKTKIEVNQNEPELVFKVPMGKSIEETTRIY